MGELPDTQRRQFPKGPGALTKPTKSPLILILTLILILIIILIIIIIILAWGADPESTSSRIPQNAHGLRPAVPSAPGSTCPIQ